MVAAEKTCRETGRCMKEPSAHQLHKYGINEWLMTYTKYKNIHGSKFVDMAKLCNTICTKNTLQYILSHCLVFTV